MSLDIRTLPDVSEIRFDDSASTFAASPDPIHSLCGEQMDGGIERLIIEWS